MAPRRVIADSDDDESSAQGSPEKPHLVALFNPVDFDDSAELPSPQNGTGSTDPIFFQAIYEEHLVARNQLPCNERQPPALEDPLTSLPMSSSPVGAIRQKHSKKTHPSSLTSHAEPATSNRTARRSKSLKDLDDLTQITTPRKSKDATGVDLWDFPGSSASNRRWNVATTFKSRNSNLKTYGKSLARSKTLGAESSIAQELESTHHLSIESPQYSAGLEMEIGSKYLKRSAPIEDETIPPTLPGKKRCKRDVSVNNEFHQIEPTEQFQIKHPATGSESNLARSTGASIQVPRSTSEEARRSGLMPLSTSSVGDIQLPLVHTYADMGYAQTVSSGPFDINNLTTSVAVIPNTLTSSQKQHYEIMNTSISSSRRSSLPEMMDTVDYNLKFTGDSSTVPNDTPMRKESSSSAQTPGSPVLQTSSASRKLKRSKLMAVQPADSSVSFASSVQIQKSTRSKKMGRHEELGTLQSSMDELSAETTESSTNTSARTSSARVEKGHTKKYIEEATVDIDELFNSDETRIPRELYQPRPSLRRSKSMSVDPVADLDLHLQGSRVSKLKSSKRSKSMGLQAIPDSKPELSKSKPSNSKSSEISKKLAVQSSSSSTNFDLNYENSSTTGSKLTKDRKSRAVPEARDILNEGRTMPELTVTAQDLEINVLDGDFSSRDVSRLGSSGSINAHVPVVDTLAGNAAIVQAVPAQPKRRGRPKKVVELATDLDTEVLDKGDTVFYSEEGVTHIHKDDTQPSSTYVYGEKDTVFYTSTEPARANRRGRPKKVGDKQKATLSEVPVSETHSFHRPEQTTPEIRSLALQEVETNESQNSQASQVQEESPTRTPSCAKSTNFLLAKTTPLRTLTEKTAPQQTSSKDMKKRSDQHSPLQGGKVPYRVGLSKRTRIAPLLKMIRK